MGTLKTMTELAGKRITDKEVMVFDWDKAAEIIKKRKPTYAAAGLRQDWENTGGLIYNKDNRFSTSIPISPQHGLALS